MASPPAPTPQSQGFMSLENHATDNIIRQLADGWLYNRMKNSFPVKDKMFIF